MRKESGYYKYDLTDLGYEILDTIKKAKSPSSPMQSLPSFRINAPSQQIASNILGKKEIAESLKFQGFRVTESYDSKEPDLVVWKDATTPQEVISVKSLIPPQSLKISIDCSKEVAFAQKNGFQQIHLICINNFNKKKIYDANVSFSDNIEVKDESQTQPAPTIQEKAEINPQQKEHSLTLNLKLSTSPVEITDRVMAVSEAFGVGVDDKKEFTIFDNVELKYNSDDLIYVTGDSGSGKSTFLRLFSDELRNQA